jgi:hypothetical protein
MTARLWIARGAVIGTAVLAVPVVTGIAPVSADACADYYAYAAGDGVLTSVGGPNVLPLGATAESETPDAHALIESGVSGAFAGSPYPGDFVYSAPGLAGVDPRTYPLTAHSQYPTTPKDSVSQGPISLVAQSAELSSKADAFNGGGSSGGDATAAGASESTANVACADSGVTADSTTDTQAVNIAGTLRLGRVHSEAHALLGADGKVTLKTGLAVGQVTVAGQTVEINTDGLSAGGQTVPLPNPLGDALKSQGITFTYVAPVKDPNGKGITAPGVEISVPLPLDQLPCPLCQGTGPTTLTFTFGRAYAAVNGSLSAGGAVDLGSGGSAVGSVGGSSGGGGSGSIAPPTASGSSVGAPSPGSSPVVAGSTPQPPQQLQALSSNAPDIDWQLLYLAIAVGAFAVIGGGVLIRQIAERLKWT